MDRASCSYPIGSPTCWSRRQCECFAPHDPLRHIAVQILQFSLSFEAEPRIVKSVLFEALRARPRFFERCTAYVLGNELRNLDHLLEYLVFDSDFAALVIIDILDGNLETVLASRFQFPVEVLELARYQGDEGERL